MYMYCTLVRLRRIRLRRPRSRATPLFVSPIPKSRFSWICGKILSIKTDWLHSQWTQVYNKTMDIVNKFGYSKRKIYKYMFLMDILDSFFVWDLLELKE